MKPISAIKFTFIFLIFIQACASKPFSKTNRVHKKHARELSKIIAATPKDSIMSDSMKLPAFDAFTVNFGLRKPNFVILHHTAQASCEQTLKTFALERTQVSAHYVICKDGTLHHMLNDYLRAWHAGAAKWGNDADINSVSIGIELDNDGFETFADAQVNALLGLLGALKKNYNIPAVNFIAHGDIAPGRKVDPNVNFPWKLLADSGYGVWYADTTNAVVPPDFNSIHALRIIGYNVTDSMATFQAFRRHFIQAEKPGELSEPEKKVLFMLLQKFM